MGWGVHDYPGEPPETPRTYCPVCGWECGTIYTDRNGSVVGCDNCITANDADEWRIEILGE